MNNDTNNNLNGEVLGSVDNGLNSANNTLNNAVTGIQNNVNNLNTEVNQAREEIRNSLGEGLNSQVITPQVESQVITPQPVNETPVSPQNPSINPTTSVVDTPPVNQNVVGERPMMQTPPVTNPTPTPMPQPAYTNPNSINPTPMPGFDNQNNIGVTPPISLEDERPPKKKTNKTLVAILLIALIAIIGFGVYYVLNYTDLLKKSEQVTITTNEAKEVSLGSELSSSVEDYALVVGTNITNCTVDTKSVDVNKEGEYEYTVTCGETSKKGIIKVVDNNELEVHLKTLYKTKGSTLEASEFAATDDGYKYEFVDQNSVNSLLNGEKGKYEVKLKVTSNNKEKEVTGSLVILDNELTGYLVCTSAEQNIENTNTSMKTEERIGIANVNNNYVYGDVAVSTYIFTVSSEEEYSKYATEYSSKGSLTINNITGTPTFDDTNKVIRISVDKENLATELGEANLNYTPMKSHYENLGYTCEYVKSE